MSNTNEIAAKKPRSQVFQPAADFLSIFRSPSAQGHRDVPELHGVRAFLTLWMILFHTFYYIGIFLTSEDQIGIYANDKQAPRYVDYIVLGLSNVDVFFILTGFLIAYPLLKQDPSKIQLKPVYWKRFIVRIYPTYIACFILYAFILFPKGLYPLWQMCKALQEAVLELFPGSEYSPSSAFLFPANLLFLNNLIPFGGAMGYTWSLAIQGQFYLFFPWLVRKVGTGRGLTISSIFAVLLCVGIRTLTFFQQHDKLTITPTMFIQSKEDLELFAVNFVLFYSPTLQRCGALFLGVLLAQIQYRIDSNGTVSSTLSPVSGWFRTLQLDQVLCVLCLVLMNERTNFYPTAWANVLIAVGGPLWCLAAAYLLFVVINRIGLIGSILSAIFRLPLWLPFSQLSYWLYLLHPQVQTKLFSTVLYKPDSTANGLFVNYGIVLALTFIGSVVGYVLIEQPCARYLSRFTPSSQPAVEKKTN